MIRYQHILVIDVKTEVLRYFQHFHVGGLAEPGGQISRDSLSPKCCFLRSEKVKKGSGLRKSRLRNFRYTNDIAE